MVALPLASLASPASPKAANAVNDQNSHSKAATYTNAPEVSDWIMPGPQLRKAAPAMPDKAGMGEFFATPSAAPINIMVTERPVPNGPWAQVNTVSRKASNAAAPLAAVTDVVPVTLAMATEEASAPATTARARPQLFVFKRNITTPKIS